MQGSPSQDIFGYHNWGMLLESSGQKVKDAAKLPTLFLIALFLIVGGPPPTTEKCQQCLGFYSLWNSFSFDHL